MNIADIAYLSYKNNQFYDAQASLLYLRGNFCRNYLQGGFKLDAAFVVVLTELTKVHHYRSLPVLHVRHIIQVGMGMLCKHNLKTISTLLKLACQKPNMIDTWLTGIFRVLQKEKANM